MESSKPKDLQHSSIKPHLVNLSGSGSTLNGIIVERNLERSYSESDHVPCTYPKHGIVLHSKYPATLEWRNNGKLNNTFFSKGDFLINPEGLFVAPHWKSEVEILLLALDPALVNRIAEEMNCSNKIELLPGFQSRDELLWQLMQSLLAEFENGLQPNHMDQIYLESLKRALVAHLIKKYSISTRKPLSTSHGLQPHKLRLIINYINDNLDQTLSLKMLANNVGFSPSYFMALFKKSMGLAPHQYVVKQRIEKAKELLIKTPTPIAQIADQTGFADQSHLTRLIVRYTGFTPKEIRGK